MHTDVFHHVLGPAPIPVILWGADQVVRAWNVEATELVEPPSDDAPARLRGSSLRDVPRSMSDLRYAPPGSRRRVPLLHHPAVVAADLVLLEDGCVLAYFSLIGRARTPAGEDPDPPSLARSDPLQRYYPFGSVATFDADGRYLSMAGQGWDALQIDASRTVGRTLRETWDPDTADRLGELAQVALAGGQACQRIEWRGHVFEVWCGPLPFVGRDPGGGMFISRDVSLEVSARRESEILQDATWATGVGVVLVDVLDPGHPMVFVGKGFERLTGYSAEECIGLNCRFLQGRGTDPFLLHQLRAALESRSVFQGVLRNYRKDGTGFWNRLTLRPWSSDGTEVTHYLGVQQDITDEYEAEVEHERRSRLAELGALGSAVAHDFNNILMEVQGRLQLLQEVHMPAGAAEEIEGIEGAVERGTTLVGQLLGQARHQELESDDHAAFARVSDLMPGVVRMLPKRIRVTWTTRDEPGPVRLAPSKLEQILLNLASNAADAMPDGGELSVAVEGMSGGDWVRIRLSDDGEGIPEAIRDKVFATFFTTKGAAGTGLGLSSVARIVNQAGGAVTFVSEVGRGTTFEVRLPMAADSVPRPATAPGPAAPGLLQGGPEAPGHGRRILMAEDEPGILRTLVHLLRRRGFEVTGAEHGREAWRIFDANPGAFDLVLADNDMPGMGGQALLRRIAERTPPNAIPPMLVLMSGAPPPDPNLPPDTLMLGKPFRIAELVEHLRRGSGGRDPRP